MIAKHVAIKSLKKADFAALVKYIIDEQNKNERVGDVTVANCESDRPDAAIIEVLNTQAQNTRATSDKTYHLIISFRPGVQPDAAALKAIEARVCDGLGYGEHQRVSAVHHDTDNLHIHIAINKIHPTRYTMHVPYYDHTTLGQLCEKLEREFGLEQDNHQARKGGAENRAADMEHHAGVESLLGWIKRECIEEIAGAQSWTELHRVMRSNGLDIHERGNGLVITAGDGTTVKASSIGRIYSRASLVARFGPFEPSPERQAGERPARTYEKKPMHSVNKAPGSTGIDTEALYARYKNEQQSAGVSRTVLWARARDRKKRLIEAAKRSGRFKRAAIRLIEAPRLGKKILYAATSATLTGEIEKINQQYFKDRQEVNDKCRRLAWADWLRARAAEGEPEALAVLRTRGADQGPKGNSLTGKGSRKPVRRDPGQDSVTKKGTIIYCVGATAVRDNGTKLEISRGADQNGLQAALRMAMARYGERISVNGTTAFKEQIVQAAAAAKLPVTFDDGVLEQRRQELLQSRSQPLPQPRGEQMGQQTKESTHEPSRRTRHERSAAGSAVRSGPTSAATRAARDGPAGAIVVHGAAGTRGARKPDIGRIGRNPPPESQHRLRRLSELGVVRIASGTEVLLPGHVPGHVEQQGAAADNGMRRAVPRAGRVSGPLAAADKAIIESEQKITILTDITKYARYDGFKGAAVFAGIRNVEGRVLALIKQGEEIKALPVDEATARRLRRLAIGAPVTVTAIGAIKTKGRSR